MAIITEEPDSTVPTKPTKRNKSTKPTPTPKPKPKPTTKPEPEPEPTTSASPQTPNPFTFWFYFTISVSLITLIFITLSSLSPTDDPKSWFLSLPTPLRHHFSSGRTIKVQLTPNLPSIEVFTIQHGPTTSNPVLIVPGLGCSSYTFNSIAKSLAHKGLHAVVIDLPGSGFSDKSNIVVEERENVGVVGAKSVWEIYNEIKEKGLFWGFDQLVEKGYVDYVEKEKVSKVETVKPIELGGEETGRVLGQVIDSMRLGPVDLVLHDSAFGLGANWVSENLGFVRSVTILDGTWTGTALPLWVLQVPVVREVVLGFGFVFRRVIGWCCSKSSDGGVDVEAHRVLLKGRDGRRAAVGMGKKLNCSFDLAEWGSLDGVKGLPKQVIWSSDSSKEWSEDGVRVASALPLASFVSHSGGRWPQDDTADELAESIYRFVSPLPKSTRQVKEEEPLPEHIQKMFDEVKASDHQHEHHHGHGGHDHGHDHEAGFMDAYGLRHGWAS